MSAPKSSPTAATVTAVATFGLAVAFGAGTAAGHGGWSDGYHGGARASYLTLDGALGIDSLAEVDLFPTVALVDGDAGTATDATHAHARGANLDALALGSLDLGGVLSEIHRDAPANADPGHATLLPVPGAPVAEVEASNAYAGAQWPGAGACPEPGNPYALASTDVARAELLDAGAVLGVPAVTVEDEAGGAFASRSWVERTGSTPVGLKALAQAQALRTTLFAGTAAEVRIDASGPFQVTAESNGSSATTTVAWPLVTITLPDTTVIGPVRADELDPVVVHLDGTLDLLLGSLGVGTITIDAGHLDTDASDGATEADISGAMLTVGVNLNLAGLTAVIADLDLAPLAASVHVPDEIDCGGVATSSTEGTGASHAATGDDAPEARGSAAGPTDERATSRTGAGTAEVARGARLADTGVGSAATFAGALLLLTTGMWLLATRGELLARLERRETDS